MRRFVKKIMNEIINNNIELSYEIKDVMMSYKFPHYKNVNLTFFAIPYVIIELFIINEGRVRLTDDEKSFLLHVYSKNVKKSLFFPFRCPSEHDNSIDIDQEIEL